ncbi:hypothetical protein CVT30_23575 [Streptomyces sp. AMCC400023]|nr:hypothetical protein CVT30_23575 [Streptomyces sp. AMCC400023]
MGTLLTVDQLDVPAWARPHPLPLRKPHDGHALPNRATADVDLPVQLVDDGGAVTGQRQRTLGASALHLGCG